MKKTSIRNKKNRWKLSLVLMNKRKRKISSPVVLVSCTSKMYLIQDMRRLSPARGVIMLNICNPQEESTGFVAPQPFQEICHFELAPLETSIFLKLSRTACKTHLLQTHALGLCVSKSKSVVRLNASTFKKIVSLSTRVTAPTLIFLIPSGISFYKALKTTSRWMMSHCASNPKQDHHPKKQFTMLIFSDY